MSRYRRPKTGDQYFVDPALFDYVVRYARLFPSWKKELAGDVMDLRRVNLERRVDMVEMAARIAAPDENLREYLLQSVTDDASAVALQMRGMPCGKDLLIKMRRRFYYELAEMVK